jgi:hypothetical protein
MEAVEAAGRDRSGETGNISAAGSDWMPEYIEGTKRHAQYMPELIANVDRWFWASNPIGTRDEQGSMVQTTAESGATMSSFNESIMWSAFDAEYGISRSS